MYESILNKFDGFALDEHNKMLLCPGERLNESHRHFSHLQALYPLHLINYDTEENRNIYHESIWELERLGTGGWVGFSFGMCAQIYAMALNGNAAYEKLRMFAKGFVAENGFHLNGDFKNYGFSLFHYRPFTLESSFGYCDALQEMLMQEHQGYIHLFPAIPDEWKKSVSFKKLRSYGGVLVSAEMKNGLPVFVKLEAKKPMTVLLKNTFGKANITVKTANGEKSVCEKDGYFTVEIISGTTFVS